MNPIVEPKMFTFEDSPAEIETANEQDCVEAGTAKEEHELDYSYYPFPPDKAGTFEFFNASEEDIYNAPEVIEVRNIPLAQIKKEVLSLLSDGNTKYIDEIAEELNLDFMVVMNAFNQLQEEGKLFMDENKL